MRLKAMHRAWNQPLMREAAVLVLVILIISGVSVGLMRRTVANQARLTTLDNANPAHGQNLFVQTCASCHGLKAQGLPHQGADLRSSSFISGQTDYGLMKFLRVGRLQGDKRSVMGLSMPPKGGNSRLSDENLADIASYLRATQKRMRAAASVLTTQPAMTMAGQGN